MLPRYIIKSAKPGDPSILWQGKSGRYYRNVVDAKTDKAENAYTPGTTISKAKASDSGSYALYAIVFVIVLFVAYKLFK